MAIKLEKMALASADEIRVLSHEQIISLTLTLLDRMEYYQGLLFRAKKNRFGQSSERSPKADRAPCQTNGNQEVSDESEKSNTETDKDIANSTKKLSTRYPNTTIQVENIGFKEPQSCASCGHEMKDSGMTEDSEYLTTSPKEYIIVRQRRQKHRCHHCHSTIVTAPAPARIVPGGSYSDEMIIDATLSKFCDLIPMERYCQMAARRGLLGLPPHSLIAASMKLSKFLKPVYDRIKEQTLNTKVLLADETPHRMLERHPIKKWFLWGFSSQISCFFECHSTRSGDVSTTVLAMSNCEILLSDVYSGYAKSVRLANEQRAINKLSLIRSAYCNAHARRKFKDRDSDDVCEDAEWMMQQYALIYKLNKESKDKKPEEILKKRLEMKPIFEAMKNEAMNKVSTYSSKSQMATAYNYFLENYEGLTLFLENHLVSIDNNHSERMLRSHVVGRKTWYGTHSPKSAQSAAVHFSIVESCKMIGVNPLEFYHDAVERIHGGSELITPHEYKLSQTPNTG